MLVQETKLRQPHEFSAAKSFLASVGFGHALFGPALLSEQHGLSGGVLLAVRSDSDIGVTSLRETVPEHLQHRAIGAVIEAPGICKHAIASLYAVPRIGVTGTNLELLGWAAATQDSEQLPLLAGGDFNFTPDALSSTDFATRSGLFLVAPSASAHITRDSERVLDWFLSSEAMSRLVFAVTTHSAASLPPHRPVQLTIQLSESTLLPVLTSPQKLPRTRPHGPSLGVPQWPELAAQMTSLGGALEAELSDSHAKPARFRGTLDSLYYQMVCVQSSQRSPGSRTRRSSGLELVPSPHASSG